jgi:hypothetical protein
VGAVVGAVEAPEVTVQETGFVELEQEGVEDLGPSAILAPAVEAIRDGLPRAVALGGVRPGGAGMQMPEDAVDEAAMLLPRMSALAVVVAVGEARLNLRPLGVRKIKAIPGWPPSGNLPTRELGATRV